jgi:polysaccharide pyruvyl transferase WcaK-like protein
MKVLLINSGLRASNWGLQAASRSLLDIMQQAAVPQRLETRTLSNDDLYLKLGFRPIFLARFLQDILHPQVLEWEVIQGLNSRKFQVPQTSDLMEEYGSKFLLDRRTKPMELKRLIQWADVVVYQGEGSAYHNNYSARAAFYLLWVAKTIFGKKTVFLNGSLGVSVDFPVLAGFAQRVLSDADVFAVREPASKRMIEKLANQPVDMIPDSAFLYPYVSRRGEAPDISDAGHGYHVVSGGMLPILPRGELRAAPFAQFCKSLLDSGRKLVFLGIDPEDQKLERLATELGQSFFGPETDLGSVLEIIRKSNGLISGRYHHLIFALAQGVPVLPFATTSQKIRGLLELYPGLTPPMLDPTSLWRDRELARDHLDRQDQNLATLSEDIQARSDVLIQKTKEDYLRVLSSVFSMDSEVL